MKKGFLFVVVLILIVSLVPLSGVSAQRPVPASSADTAPAARATYYKQIKTQVKMYSGPTLAFKYVQKLYWGYDYSIIQSWAATMKGVCFMPAYCTYLGYKLKSSAGGPGYTYYYRWTRGKFYWSGGGAGYYALHIEQEVYPNGTWWKHKGWTGPT